MATRLVPDQKKIDEARMHGAIIGNTLPRSLMKEVEIEPLQSRVVGTPQQQAYIAEQLATVRQPQTDDTPKNEPDSKPTYETQSLRIQDGETRLDFIRRMMDQAQTADPQAEAQAAEKSQADQFHEYFQKVAKEVDEDMRRRNGCR